MKNLTIVFISIVLFIGLSNTAKAGGLSNTVKMYVCAIINVSQPAVCEDASGTISTRFYTASTNLGTVNRSYVGPGQYYFVTLYSGYLGWYANVVVDAHTAYYDENQNPYSTWYQCDADEIYNCTTQNYTHDLTLTATPHGEDEIPTE